MQKKKKWPIFNSIGITKYINNYKVNDYNTFIKFTKIIKIKMKIKCTRNVQRFHSE